MEKLIMRSFRLPKSLIEKLEKQAEQETKQKIKETGDKKEKVKVIEIVRRKLSCE